MKKIFVLFPTVTDSSLSHTMKVDIFVTVTMPHTFHTSIAKSVRVLIKSVTHPSTGVLMAPVTISNILTLEKLSRAWATFVFQGKKIGIICL